MGASIGIVTAEGISAGLVDANRKISGRILQYPEHGGVADDLTTLPANKIAEKLAEIILEVAAGQHVDSVGLAFPGVIRGGVVEESPNFPQMKGQQISKAVCTHLEAHGQSPKVVVSNDADVVAAGIAATRNQLDHLIRVWTLGNGIGYGRYPSGTEIWEGGHTVVTMDPKEKYCSCGGVGHLEGIMGYRSMRLRFLDLEPEEIFEQAHEGDARCMDFVKLWHRALAAATASSVHMEGPGKFFITGPSARYLNLSMLHRYMHEMVMMSTLQGYVFEIVPGGHEIAIIGAAVSAAMEQPATVTAAP